jgi:hypothetical protein
VWDRVLRSVVDTPAIDESVDELEDGALVGGAEFLDAL